jgi:Flp pilus assembly pilin Flp
MVAPVAEGYRRRMEQHHHHENGQTSVEYALTIVIAIGLATALAALVTPAGDVVARVVDVIAAAL